MNILILFQISIHYIIYTYIYNTILYIGTLNPALHDDEGKPKRNLSTIVHILNDLLGAAPQGKITPSALSQLERAQHHQQLQQQSSSKISSRRKGHFKSKG